jgi:small subunit ribosomal protein S8
MKSLKTCQKSLPVKKDLLSFQEYFKILIFRMIKIIKKINMVNDTIGDMLTRIRNACMAKKTIVAVPLTRMNQQISQILEREGFIQNFQISEDSKYLNLRLKYSSKQLLNGKRKESCITNLKRISKPGLRIYSNSKEIPRILGGAGIVILSTPGGILTDREARSLGVGGELLCSIW